MQQDSKSADQVVFPRLHYERWSPPQCYEYYPLPPEQATYSSLVAAKIELEKLVRHAYFSKKKDGSSQFLIPSGLNNFVFLKGAMLLVNAKQNLKGAYADWIRTLPGYADIESFQADHPYRIFPTPCYSSREGVSIPIEGFEPPEESEKKLTNILSKISPHPNYELRESVEKILERIVKYYAQPKGSVSPWEDLFTLQETANISKLMHPKPHFSFVDKLLLKANKYLWEMITDSDHNPIITAAFVHNVIVYVFPLVTPPEPIARMISNFILCAHGLVPIPSGNYKGYPEATTSDMLESPRVDTDTKLTICIGSITKLILKMQTDPYCANCGSDAKCKRCTHCYTVAYCSKKCQKEGYLGHKPFCKRNKDVATELRACTERYVKSAQEILDLQQNISDLTIFCGDASFNDTV